MVKKTALVKRLTAQKYVNEDEHVNLSLDDIKIPAEQAKDVKITTTKSQKVKKNNKIKIVCWKDDGTISIIEDLTIKEKIRSYCPKELVKTMYVLNHRFIFVYTI